jgi:hypothetical protein
MRRSNAVDGGFESRHRVERGLRRWSALGLSAAACACSSSSDEPGPTRPAKAGPGGEPAEVPASGGAGVAPADPSESDADGAGVAPASVEEAQDPNALGHVVPEPLPGGAAVDPPLPSSGCAPPTRTSSGAQGLDVEGVARTHRLDLPPGYDGTTPYPLVFAFHGATARRVLSQRALRQPAVHHGRRRHPGAP